MLAQSDLILYHKLVKGRFGLLSTVLAGRSFRIHHPWRVSATCATIQGPQFHHLLGAFFQPQANSHMYLHSQCQFCSINGSEKEKKNYVCILILGSIQQFDHNLGLQIFRGFSFILHTNFCWKMWYFYRHVAKFDGRLHCLIENPIYAKYRFAKCL